ncbi:MAG: hypothetical protein JSW47_06490 [Phycisphaerales bacterium]|nr:MAG: hypothetical protein JSW47_06490 [Phycisphaerales bacterium]
MGQGKQENSLDPAYARFAQSPTKLSWYAHEPWKDCASCHDVQRQAESPSQTYFLAPVPELCYNCHTDHRDATSSVHGPVAVGDCLFCHDPHKSRIEHLLKQPVPKLCYLCHDMNDIGSIPAHPIEEASKCTDCHDAHASFARTLLKEASSQ